MRHNEPVSHIMSNEMHTVHIGQKVSDVYKLLAEKSIHHVPVVSGDKLVGLVSSNDMMRLSLQVYGTPDSDNAEYLDSQFSLDQVMSKDLTTIKSDDAIRFAAEKLSSGTFHSLPVMDSDDKIVGIVTTTDLVKYLLDQY